MTIFLALPIGFGLLFPRNATLARSFQSLCSLHTPPSCRCSKSRMMFSLKRTKHSKTHSYTFSRHHKLFLAPSSLSHHLKVVNVNKSSTPHIVSKQLCDAHLKQSSILEAGENRKFILIRVSSLAPAYVSVLISKVQGTFATPEAIFVKRRATSDPTSGKFNCKVSHRSMSSRYFSRERSTSCRSATSNRLFRQKITIFD